MSEKIIEGVEIAFGQKKLIVPPLSLGQLKRLRGDLEKLAAVNTADQQIDDATVDAMVHIVTAAIKRNYPDMKEEDVAEALDLSNLPTVVQAVLGVSGLKKVTAVAPAALTQDP